MNADHWLRIKELFHSALEQPAAARAAFLQQACAEDAAGREEIERLLAAHLEAGTFIERSPLAGLLSTELLTPLTGRLMGHYRLECLIGIGGMGVVYAARDIDLERVVALKVVNGDEPDAQVRLRQEAQRASQLNHPHICIVHEVGESAGMTYFVMEHVDGETLGAVVSRRPLPLESVLRYGSQIADALGHAHERGVIHRDLKSANVMVTRDGRAKILDFGLARAAPTSRVNELSRSKEALSVSEPIAGTLPYMAPELLRAEPADARTDIWALGVVLYEMAAGQRPFSGLTGFEVSAAILHEQIAPLPDRLPASLQSIIRRCLARDRHERYAHAGEVAAAIDAVRAELASGAAQEKTLRRAPAQASVSGHLPSARTSFIGRIEELVRFSREIESSRLVTLTGVGGCGKTRLALRLAEQSGAAFRDGAWWVDLASIADPTRVDEAVASALGFLNQQRPPRDSLLESLVDRRLLLVLDNCEHVLTAAADLSDVLLARTAGVHILATSREGLGVMGERVLAVPSLSIPTGLAASDPHALAACDAVRLFSERAAAIQPGFSITAANGSIVLDICRRLEGIPLAIELAAARARLLSVEQIRERLEDRLALLSGRGRAVPRHQTLGAALQWSYDLLTQDEQRTLRLLSAFQGGWTLSAATAVCGERVGGVEMLDLLWRLVEKSLVEVVHTEGSEARYRLLEMVRQFAFDRLAAASEVPEAEARHAAHFLGRFEHAIPDLIGPREAETVASLETELDNLLASLDESTALEAGSERVMRAASDGWLFWVARGRIALGRGVLASALQHGTRTSADARAKALMASSMLARFAGDGAHALADADAGVSLYEELHDADPSGFAFALFQRAAAQVTFAASDASAHRDLVRGVALSRRAGDRMMVGICLNMLGLIAVRGSARADAESQFLEALTTARELRSPYLQILYLQNLASIYADEGRWSQSIELTREALELVCESGNRHFAPASVLGAARVLGGLGRVGGAWRLFGAAIGMWAQIGEAAPTDEVTGTERELASCEAQPGGGDRARLQAEGRMLAFDAAVDEALAALGQT